MGANMKIVLGKESVVCQGMTFEENPWGAYQFPIPSKNGNKLYCSVHVEDDNLIDSGNPRKWFESTDNGKTWKEVPSTVAASSGFLLANGDKVFIPYDGGVDLKNYKFPKRGALTPAYDFSKQANEGEMPIPDGVLGWFVGNSFYAYNEKRLPPSLSGSSWHIQRIKKGKTAPVDETVPIDWPFLTRVVLKTSDGGLMKPIWPKGTLKTGPDGAVWVSGFSGEGHINPENGQFSPYYSAEIFRSDDFCHSFKRISHMEYPADGQEYPYLSGGFSDSDFAFFDDGSMSWFFRSAWFGSTGFEWAPMYWARSFDFGKTWTKPEKFAFTGIFPRLCRLNCGATLICYARPGVFVQACRNSDGLGWTEPVTVMTPEDRSKLANVVVQNPDFHQWDGACNNPTLLEISDDTALIFYSDFYYPDENGVKKKTILCRPITIIND